MSRSWRVGAARKVSLEPFALMGILNVTPDSFSDGGAHLDVAAAVERARAMHAEGAAILDVGGESTRPGAARIDAAEQRRRVEPVVREIRRALPDVAITIDTTLADVAAAALDAGADGVNDVSAGTEDERMLPLVVRRDVGIVLMHRVLPPGDDRYSHAHASSLVGGDVVERVHAWAVRRGAEAQSLGIDADRIVIDPGLGFGKTVDENWSLIARSGELASAGYPLLVGASRKSFVGHVTGVKDPAHRVAGSLIAAAIAFAAGAAIIRTHDVRATREALLATGAALRATRADDDASSGHA
ncbi:MAG: dihydropteroate synthase [Phycisphaerae bacterium]|nr:dihydropteroate synthase [Phycisphaerae bacterium]